MNFKSSIRQSVYIRFLSCVHYLKQRCYALLYVILVLSAGTLLLYVYSTGKGQPIKFGMLAFVMFVASGALVVVMFKVIFRLIVAFDFLLYPQDKFENHESSLSYRKLEDSGDLEDGEEEEI